MDKDVLNIRPVQSFFLHRSWLFLQRRVYAIAGTPVWHVVNLEVATRHTVLQELVKLEVELLQKNYRGRKKEVNGGGRWFHLVISRLDN
jgi:hypothetical protein